MLEIHQLDVENKTFPLVTKLGPCLFYALTREVILQMFGRL